MNLLIPPYGNRLVDLCVPNEEIAGMKARANLLPSIQLSNRCVCDLELLATGAFSPLDRFMCRKDYERVVAEMRLADGYVFPIPVTLPIESGVDIHLDQEIALRDAKNDLLATMTIEEIYDWDQTELAQQVLGTTDSRHPLIGEMTEWGKRNISGSLQVWRLPNHYDFKELRLTPSQARSRLRQLGKKNVVAFQTRNPLHRAHEELTKRAIDAVDGILLLHPVVGLTKPGDIDHYTRVRGYSIIVQRYYTPSRVLLALLPLAMRMAGPREALWHAVIRRNYGANYIIVGRDHAGPGLNSNGKPFYGPYDSVRLVEQFCSELGVGVVPFEEMVYLPSEQRYEEISRVSPGQRVLNISGTQVINEFLSKGRALPEWFTRPEVSDILADSYPSGCRQGVCIWFTGLPCSGKSTTAEILTVLLQERGRRVTLLDGDIVRTNLSKGLGFTREDRDINVKRIGFVASEIVRHGGIVICAAVSPYRTTRDHVRSLIGEDRFIEVFVDTPLEICEQRDKKGLYAKARLAHITGVTGVDDPYEPPGQPEITLDTVAYSAEQNARAIRDYLSTCGFVKQHYTGHSVEPNASSEMRP